MSSGAETPSEKTARLIRLGQPPPHLVELAQLAREAAPIIRAVAQHRPLDVDAARRLLGLLEAAGCAGTGEPAKRFVDPLQELEGRT